MAKTKKDDDREAVDDFVNEPSSLDELTHHELRMMHTAATTNLLFAKNIQWRSVGSTLFIFIGLIAITQFTAAANSSKHLLPLLIIVLTCGVIFVLLMYQFWQFNEVSRVREIEKHFSSLYNKVNGFKSRREANTHRYTLLVFMITVVIIGAIVTSIALQQIIALK